MATGIVCIIYCTLVSGQVISDVRNRNTDNHTIVYTMPMAPCNMQAYVDYVDRAMDTYGNTRITNFKLLSVKK